MSVDEGGSAQEVQAWSQALFGDRPSFEVRNRWMVLSADVHEIRAYNRLARLARGAMLVFLQGDYCVPPSGDWLRDALEIFEALPRLGLLGGNQGKDLSGGAFSTGKKWGPIPPATRWEGGVQPIDFALQSRPKSNRRWPLPVRFVSAVNIGPLIVRR